MEKWLKRTWIASNAEEKRLNSSETNAPGDGLFPEHGSEESEMQPKGASLKCEHDTTTKIQTKRSCVEM